MWRQMFWLGVPTEQDPSGAQHRQAVSLISQFDKRFQSCQAVLWVLQGTPLASHALLSLAMQAAQLCRTGPLRNATQPCMPCHAHLTLLRLPTTPAVPPVQTSTSYRRCSGTCGQMS